jgi:hypothetical protein
VVYSPHAEAVEVQQSRGTRLHNSVGVLPSRTLPPLPSTRFASHCALLGYAVNTGLCNSEGHVTSVMLLATIQSAAFSRMSDSSVYRRD